MNQKKLRSVLGMCNVYRRFVKGFAKIAATVNRKTGRNERFEFELLTDAELDAFEEQEKRLVSLLILSLPRHGRKYTLYTSARGHEVGSALQRVALIHISVTRVADYPTPSESKPRLRRNFWPPSVAS